MMDELVKIDNRVSVAMMREGRHEYLMRTAIEHEVRRQIDMQKEELCEALFRGCDDSSTAEDRASQILVNAVYCSVTLAAEMARQQINKHKNSMEKRG